MITSTVAVLIVEGGTSHSPPGGMVVVRLERAKGRLLLKRQHLIGPFLIGLCRSLLVHRCMGSHVPAMH